MFAFSSPLGYAVQVRLFAVVFDVKNLQSEDYGNLHIRLQVTRARRVLENVYALKSDQSASQVKDYFRAALGRSDGLLFLVVAAYASQRAAFDFGEM